MGATMVAAIEEPFFRRTELMAKNIATFAIATTYCTPRTARNRRLSVSPIPKYRLPEISAATSAIKNITLVAIHTVMSFAVYTLLREYPREKIFLTVCCSSIWSISIWYMAIAAM